MVQTRQKVFRIVPKCPKMSQNFPKCPLQTHRCPNGLVLLLFDALYYEVIFLAKTNIRQRWLDVILLRRLALWRSNGVEIQNNTSGSINQSTNQTWFSHRLSCVFCCFFFLLKNQSKSFVFLVQTEADFLHISSCIQIHV